MSFEHVKWWLRFFLRCFVFMAFVAIPARAATNVVTTLDDSGAGSLRQVISNSVSGDTIIFATNGTISLASGELFIKTNLNLIGRGTNDSVISGSGLSRIFNISTNVTVHISDLTIRNGHSSNGLNGGCCWTYGQSNVADGIFAAPGENGGAVYNRGTLVLSNCLVTANQAGNGGNGGNGGTPIFQGNPGNPSYAHGGDGGLGGFGGAIYNLGTLTLLNCVLSSSLAGIGGQGGQGGNAYYHPAGRRGDDGGGGGIWSASGSVYAVRSLFSGNQTGTATGSEFPGFGVCSGGGIGGSAPFTGIACSLSENTALTGGGFYGGNISVSASTFSRNRSFQRGAAIYATGLVMVSCTVASNIAPSGLEGGAVRFSMATIRNSIIANNTTPNFGGGPYTLEATNLTGTITNLLLGPLTNNGGPTLTHALLPGSPAIDAGDDTLTGTDQRGLPRRSGTHVDIGAYELQVIPPTSVRMLTNGAFAFTVFSETPFSVVANPDITEVSNQWIYLGPATEIGPGVYEFTDTNLTYNPYRFYRMRWP